MNTKPFLAVNAFSSMYDHSSRLIHDMRNHQRAYAASVVPSQMTFGVVSVGSSSASQTATITNIGYRALPILSVIGVGDYLISDSAPAVLGVGQSFEIVVQFKPTRNGLATGGVYVNTGDAAGTEFIQFNGYGSGGSGGGGLPVISIMPGTVVESTDGGGTGVTTLAPTVFSFGSVNVNDSSTERNFVISNGSSLPVEVSAITVPTGFRVVANYVGQSIPAMGSLIIKLVFEPTTNIAYSGSLSITTTAGVLTSSLTGTGVPVVVLERLRTLGNQIVKVSDNTPVVLKSVNWFGAEGLNHTPHGTWLVRYTDIIDDIKTMGFNCIRLPFSGQTFNATPPVTAFDFDLNPEFQGLTAIQVLDIIIDYCGEQGIYVVLDHHRREAGAGADGSPISGTYTEGAWITTWSQMATRYKDNLTVVGADLHNEPHDLTWNAWATLAETCGNAIHGIAPNWLIFVEGVGSYNDQSYWWGGQLAGVKDRPVVLTTANRLVYSPHEYGQSVASQQWLAQDGQTLPANWPNNLYTKWADNWSFIFYDNIAPVWIGEMGGFFGVDGSGNLTKPHGAYETVWMNELIKHITGKETPTATSVGKSMSWAFWSYNPNSGDTGGLVQDNWTTHQQVKLDILAPALNFNGVTPAPEVRGMLWQTLNTNVDYRRNWDSLGITRTMFQWVAVDGSSFIPQGILPLHTGQLNLTEIAAQPWASEIVIGLPGIFNEATARASASDLATLAQQFGSLTYPSNKIGFYFPIEIDPTWTAAPTVLAPLWSLLPRPLYVSCYYGVGTSTPTETLAAANWLKSFIPSDVTLLFQDGVGAHEVSITEAKRRYLELRSVFGSQKVELIMEAFRVNPAYAGVEGTYFIPATAAQLNAQFAAYAGYSMWLFDGPTYLTEQLIADVTGEPLVVLPSGLAANANGTDVVFTWAADPSAHFNVINYDVATGAVISNTVVTSNSYTFTAAAQTAQYGFTVTFVHFAVRKISPSGSIITSFADFSGNVT